jgi:hypothetical protein
MVQAPEDEIACLKIMRLVTKLVTWLVALLGVLWGIFVLSSLGAREINSYDNRWHLLAWFAVGLVCILASCIAAWNPRLAALVFLASTLPIVLLSLNSSFRADLNRGDAWIFGPLLFCGLFWLFTGRAGWPPLQVQQVPARRKVVISVLVFTSLACLVVIGAVVMTMRSIRLTVDCGWPNSFTADRYNSRVVFVATLKDPGVGVIKERFRGIRARTRYVLIAFWGIGHNEASGRTYYVEGRYANGWITRFLPIIDMSHCSRSSPLDQAALDIRILREGPSQKGVRIVGQVRGNHNQLRLGAKVVVAGPMGTKAVSTDSDGIFDLRDLVPGLYELRVEQCDERRNPAYNRCSANADLVAGKTWGVELSSFYQ